LQSHDNDLPLFTSIRASLFFAAFTTVTMVSGVALADPVPDITAPGGAESLESKEARFRLPAEVLDKKGYLKPKVVAPSGYDDAPPPYRSVTRRHRGMWVGGTALAGSLWIASSGASLLGYCWSGGCSDESDGDPSYLLGVIPLGGPFVQAGINASQERISSADGVAMLSGVGQIAGAALLIAGLLTDQEVWLLDRGSARIDFQLSPEITGVMGSF
jgi:hypothetical protein